MTRAFSLYSGSAGSLERPEVAERLGAEARQDLQKLAQHYRPSERMRYSALLLTLHTLYGVHCGMLASLFCRQLLGGGNSGGGIGDFFGDYVRRELSSSTVTADDCSWLRKSLSADCGMASLLPSRTGRSLDLFRAALRVWFVGATGWLKTFAVKWTWPVCAANEQFVAFQLLNVERNKKNWNPQLFMYWDTCC